MYVLNILFKMVNKTFRIMVYKLHLLIDWHLSRIKLQHVLQILKFNVLLTVLVFTPHEVYTPPRFQNLLGGPLLGTALSAKA